MHHAKHHAMCTHCRSLRSLQLSFERYFNDVRYDNADVSPSKLPFGNLYFTFNNYNSSQRTIFLATLFPYGTTLKLQHHHFLAMDEKLPQKYRPRSPHRRETFSTPYIPFSRRHHGILVIQHVFNSTVIIIFIPPCMENV